MTLCELQAFAEQHGLPIAGPFSGCETPQTITLDTDAFQPEHFAVIETELGCVPYEQSGPMAKTAAIDLALHFDCVKSSGDTKTVTFIEQTP